MCVCVKSFAMGKWPLPPGVSPHCRERVSLHSLEEGRAEVHELGDDRTGWQRKRWVAPSVARNQPTESFSSTADATSGVFFFPPTGESTIFSSAPMGFYILGSLVMLIGAKYLAGQSVWGCWWLLTNYFIWYSAYNTLVSKTCAPACHFFDAVSSLVHFRKKLNPHRAGPPLSVAPTDLPGQTSTNHFQILQNYFSLCFFNLKFFFFPSPWTVTSCHHWCMLSMSLWRNSRSSW